MGEGGKVLNQEKNKKYFFPLERTRVNQVQVEKFVAEEKFYKPRNALMTLQLSDKNTSQISQT